MACLRDPRVLMHEPAKCAARLRAIGAAGAASPASGDRVLFRPEFWAGAYVGPSGRRSKLAYEAEILALTLDAGAPR